MEKNKDCSSLPGQKCLRFTDAGEGYLQGCSVSGLCAQRRKIIASGREHLMGVPGGEEEVERVRSGIRATDSAK
jgi:hypothetical protein